MASRNLGDSTAADIYANWRDYVAPRKRPYPSEPPYVPTPEQIRIGCLEVQERWSEAERRRRAGVYCVTQAELYEYSPAFRQSGSYLVGGKDER